MRFLYLLLVLITITLADEFATPSTWQGTNITASIQDRQSTIKAAIKEVFDNGTTAAGGDFFAILAVSDLYTNQTFFEKEVAAYFSNTTLTPSEFVRAPNFPIQQGVDAMRAYQLYQIPAILDLATQAWGYGRAFTISDTNVATGSIPTKSFSFVNKTCSNVTMVGGTFWRTDQNDANILGGATALFFTLSAYLYQATSNVTYLDAAKDSGAFMLDVMNITGLNNGIAAISVNDSVSCVDLFGAGSFRIDQAGYLLEGLAVIPTNISIGRENISVDTLRRNLVNTTITTNIYCDTSNGIIQAGVSFPAGAEAAVQGFGALYHALTGSTDLKTFIGNFLSVQYNAIVTNATASNSSIYVGSWNGPPPEHAQYNSANQTQAIFALVNAAQVTQFSISETNSTSPSNKRHSLNPVGPIVGAVVGTVAFLAIISLVIFMFLKTRRQRASEWNINPFDSQSVITQDSDSPRPQLPSDGKTEDLDGCNSVYLSDEKGPQKQLMNWGSGPESSTATSSYPISEDPRSRTDTKRFSKISTNRLLRVLQARIRQEGVVGSEVSSSPPGYASSGVQQ